MENPEIIASKGKAFFHKHERIIIIGGAIAGIITLFLAIRKKANTDSGLMSYNYPVSAGYSGGGGVASSPDALPVITVIPAEPVAETPTESAPIEQAIVPSQPAVISLDIAGDNSTGMDMSYSGDFSSANSSQRQTSLGFFAKLFGASLSTGRAGTDEKINRQEISISQRQGGGYAGSLNASGLDPQETADLLSSFENLMGTNDERNRAVQVANAQQANNAALLAGLSLGKGNITTYAPILAR